MTAYNGCNGKLVNFGLDAVGERCDAYVAKALDRVENMWVVERGSLKKG